MLEHTSGLYVTRFAGPVRDDGGPRTMYQITAEHGGHVRLAADQWKALVQVCAAIAKLDAGKPNHRPHELCDCYHRGPCAAFHCAAQPDRTIPG